MELVARDAERLEHTQALIANAVYPVLAVLVVLVVVTVFFKIKARKARRTSSDHPLHI